VGRLDDFEECGGILTWVGVLSGWHERGLELSVHCKLGSIVLWSMDVVQDLSLKVLQHVTIDPQPLVDFKIS